MLNTNIPLKFLCFGSITLIKCVKPREVAILTKDATTKIILDYHVENVLKIVKKQKHNLICPNYVGRNGLVTYIEQGSDRVANQEMQLRSAKGTARVRSRDILKLDQEVVRVRSRSS